MGLRTLRIRVLNLIKPDVNIFTLTTSYQHDHDVIA